MAIEKRSKVSPVARAKTGNHQEDDPTQIEDAGQRKKVQNRIAQRTYRERMKKRLRDLENFRHASAAVMSPLEMPGLCLSSSESSSTRTLGGRRSEGASLITVSPPSSMSANDMHQISDCIEASESVSCSDAYATGATEACLAQATPRESPKMNVPTKDSMSLFLEPYDVSLDQAVWSFGAHADIGIQEMEVVTPAEDQLSPKVGASSVLPELEMPGIRTPNGNRHNMSRSDLQTAPSRKTALHIAAEHGRTSTVLLLLSLNPDLGAQDSMGQTALHLAVQNQHEDVIEELVKATMDIGACDKAGRSALHVAATIGNGHAVACLLEAGADPECKDAGGRTAMHIAAAQGWDSVLQSLIEKGADINAAIQ